MSIYKATVSLCPVCAGDCASHYDERPDGMWLVIDCLKHGVSEEKVENSADFFKWGYEQEYPKPYDYLVMPVTYRCNLKCKYCYTCSNADFSLPKDRPLGELTGIMNGFRGKIFLIGGEPTVRDDLIELIERAKTDRRREVGLGTNGQKLKDPAYVKALRDAGLDFVFLSLNDAAYEGSAIVRQNKLAALDNCLQQRLPVWLHQTLDALPQLDSLFDVIRDYRHIIFNITIRAVKPFGLIYPQHEFFVSDILSYLGKENDYSKGFSFFNRRIDLQGIGAKVCSWVNDVARLDPVDSRYLISDGSIVSFHRGMKADELLLKEYGAAQKRA